jgi:hypothetical protein
MTFPHFGARGAKLGSNREQLSTHLEEIVMKKQMALTWNAVMDNRFNPLKHLDLRSGHFLMQILSWMWSMIFSVSFLSIYQFGYVWVAHLLVIGGVFVTMSIFDRAEAQREKVGPAPYLSGASASVWQMDREG